MTIWVKSLLWARRGCRSIRLLAFLALSLTPLLSLLSASSNSARSVGCASRDGVREDQGRQPHRWDGRWELFGIPRLHFPNHLFPCRLCIFVRSDLFPARLIILNVFLVRPLYRLKIFLLFALRCLLHGLIKARVWWCKFEHFSCVDLLKIRLTQFHFVFLWRCFGDWQ